MKVIELLNKIANGEEVPNKIKYRKCIFEYEEKYKDYFTKDGIIPTTFDTNGIFRNIFLDYNNFLNDEVEIIEPQEHKIPEKLKLYKLSDNYSANISTLQDFNNKNIQITINEILDYLEVNNDRKGS